MNVSSLSSPQSATSYGFGNVGLINGSLSYLYSSSPLRCRSKASTINLHELVEGYRHIRELEPEDYRDTANEPWHQSLHIDRNDTFLYGRMYLPRSTLEALYLRRLSPTRQLKLACVSDTSLEQRGNILALLQNDHGKFSTEYLYSTDGALLGARGLYNFGYDPRQGSQQSLPPEQLGGRLSAGGEVYYGLLNKSGGVSAGMRFSTLPKHTGFPYTMTLTFNPLMGNLSSSYAIKAGRNVALCSQFDFNFFSYESDLRLGCEIWRPSQHSDAEWAKKMIREDWKSGTLHPEDDSSGVLKARWDQNWKIGLLWEGRIKELLFTLGVSLDMKDKDRLFREVGAELQFSS